MDKIAEGEVNVRSLVQRFTAWAVSLIHTLGGDISHWQGLWDAVKAYAAGWRFVFIRAGSVTDATGELYEDFRFRENAAKALGIFKWFGFYWYFRPNHDPVAQAKYFANLIKLTGFTLLPVVDVEAHGNRTPEQVRTALKTFIVTLLAELGLDQVIIYTRQSFWDTYVAPDPLFSAMPLFAARYKDGMTSPWSDGLFKFRDWLIWAFWQFSADGNGQGAKYGCQSNDVDLDYVNGDIEQYSYAGIEDTQMEERIAKLEADVAKLFDLNAAQAKEISQNRWRITSNVYPRLEALEAIPAAARALLLKILGTGE